MQMIVPVLDEHDTKALYGQLYEYIKKSITAGHIRPGEKLPSLRALSKSLGVSITTVDLAYQQLQVEGYIYSRPQSGYYVNPIAASQPETGRAAGQEPMLPVHGTPPLSQGRAASLDELIPRPPFYIDDSAFDFVKWKKCLNKILNDYPHALLSEGDFQGEPALRAQIARYAYQSRGVRCTPEQVVIGAGAQQIMSLLCSLLEQQQIRCACFEDPGYLRVRKVFADRQFDLRYIPVSRDGIVQSALPGFSCSVYVSPSNQFPTSALMPAGRRYELLEWARATKSIIIEDDYDSELRYFGKPVPSLQGLDQNQCVVYLGSFSATLFPAIKISYMILPQRMSALFQQMKDSRTQTCSKTEQLTLALYLEKGCYQTHIKKLRILYAQKSAAALGALQLYLGEQIEALEHTSGLHLIIKMKPSCALQRKALCERAVQNGLALFPVSELMALSPPQPSAYEHMLVFYYTRIPLDKIKEAIHSIASR